MLTVSIGFFVFLQKNIMAKLTFIQTQLIEDVFNMGSGYFLDLSNRQFEEFMYDVVGYNIYSKYPGLSKAKMFRAFCRDEEDRFVGKAIISAINYTREKGLCYGDNQKVNKLCELGKILLGKNETPKKEIKQQQSYNSTIESTIDYNSIIDELLIIETQKTQQLKGYAFEKFLAWLFGIFKMDPRASYKTDTDQIDGSFVLGDSTILFEAKYKSNVINTPDLVLFNAKLEHKSSQTRGLFVSYSEVSSNAISYFSNQGSRITILYTSEIYHMCRFQADLKKIIKAKFRHLDETGSIWYPINDYDKLK